jgi:hypothetical protein
VVQDTGAKFVLKYQDRTRWVEKLKVGCHDLTSFAEGPAGGLGVVLLCILRLLCAVET